MTYAAGSGNDFSNFSVRVGMLVTRTAHDRGIGRDTGDVEIIVRR